MSDECKDCGGRGWNLRDGRIDPCRCGTFEPPKWVQRGDAPCLLPHFNDPDRPRRASSGWLCAGHYSRLEQMIAELPSIYDELGQALTSSEKPNNEGGHAKHSQVAGGVNLNKNVVEARDEIQAECWRMAHEVAEARGIDLPTVDTINAIAAWLLAQLDWIADQNDVDDTYGNLDRLTRGCRQLAYPSKRQKIDLTERTGLACQTVTSCDMTTHDNLPCGGKLRALLTGGGWEGDEGRLTCDRCGQTRPITLVALADFGECA